MGRADASLAGRGVSQGGRPEPRGGGEGSEPDTVHAVGLRVVALLSQREKLRPLMSRARGR